MTSNLHAHLDGLKVCLDREQHIVIMVSMSVFQPQRQILLSLGEIRQHRDRGMITPLALIWLLWNQGSGM